MFMFISVCTVRQFKCGCLMLIGIVCLITDDDTEHNTIDFTSTDHVLYIIMNLVSLFLKVILIYHCR